MNRQDSLRHYETVLAKARDISDEAVRRARRELCLTDLYYLLVFELGRRDLLHGRSEQAADWLCDRVREVEAEPDGRLDLWAREHYKSTIITFGLTIQDILRDPETTVGLFSFNRPTAKAFLRQIKRELEANEGLKELFSDVLWTAPQQESPKWSEDEGVTVRRRGNPKEATVEAHGLVDGQPTGRHFTLLVYDDVVTRESVTSPEQIRKVTDAWALSLNLGARGGRRRMIGTRYHFADTYRTVMERQAFLPRIHPATVDGRCVAEGGELRSAPVLLEPCELLAKRLEQGPYVFGCQMLQDPRADQSQGFRREWLRFYDRCGPDGDARPWLDWNLYLLCDPAGEKKRGSDYTVLAVVGLGPDGNHYLVDGVRDRLSLQERTQALLRLHRLYRPRAVGYEKYGKDSDIEHVLDAQERANYRFPITALGGSLAKHDRIRRLAPLFEQGRFLLPRELPFLDAEARQRDFVREFVDEEYLAFPVGLHDDMLDCMARILDRDLGAAFPRPDQGPRQTHADAGPGVRIPSAPIR